MASNSTTPVPVAVIGVPGNILALVGPILLGGLFSWFLFGILCVQLYIYYLSFPQDQLPVQITVYGLFALDIFQSVIVTSTAWNFLCSGWGDLNHLRFFGWAYAWVPIVSGVVSAWVQCFYAWRIYVLGRRKIQWALVASFIIAVALAQSISAVVGGIKLIIIDSDVTKQLPLFPIVCVWLGGSVACDVIIALSMVFLLSSAKRKSQGIRRTELIMARLIRMTIETGAVTAIAASLDLGFFLGFETNNLHMSMAVILSKLYTNSLMVSLNSRAGIFAEGSSRSRSFHSSGEASTRAFPVFGIPGSSMNTHSRSETPGIHISQYTETSGHGDRKPAIVDNEDDAFPMNDINFAKESNSRLTPNRSA